MDKFTRYTTIAMWWLLLLVCRLVDHMHVHRNAPLPHTQLVLVLTWVCRCVVLCVFVGQKQSRVTNLC